MWKNKDLLFNRMIKRKSPYKYRKEKNMQYDYLIVGAGLFWCCVLLMKQKKGMSSYLIKDLILPEIFEEKYRRNSCT